MQWKYFYCNEEKRVNLFSSREEFIVLCRFNLTFNIKRKIMQIFFHLKILRNVRMRKEAIHNKKF